MRSTLPATDLCLNGREYSHLIPRGVAPIHRLAAQVVVATIANNIVMKQFTPFVDASLMRMANLYANVAQIGSPAELGRVFGMITDMALKLNGQGTRRRESWGAGGHRDLRRKLRRGRGGNHRSCDRGLEERSTDFLRPPPQLFFSHRFICGQLPLVPASSFLGHAAGEEREVRPSRHAPAVLRPARLRRCGLRPRTSSRAAPDFECAAVTRREAQLTPAIAANAV